ncbi:hypothetical protein [Thermococcus sp.]|uniref:hypothetical protein n=1 Tax=Thermococcus sp. TaxID=35749 RepID=UPI00261773A2|nr:hypothetical protein [Thermococcus sp.]
MKVVALMSSGIDSPVAIYLMLQKGLHVIPVHFRQDFIKEKKVFELVEVLKGYGEIEEPLVIDFSEEHIPTFERLREFGEEQWTCVVCKWLMLRRACREGKSRDALAIITGDSLGQVASQTLDNLAIISTASDLPVLRPLIGLDKEEVVSIARAIGTFEVSSRPEGPCPFVPRHPVIRGSHRKFEKLLKLLNL